MKSKRRKNMKTVSWKLKKEKNFFEETNKKYEKTLKNIQPFQ